MNGGIVKASIGAAILGGIGALCLWAGNTMSNEKEAMANWSTTDATIQASSVVEKTGGQRGLTQGFAPSVQYSFVVGDETYDGDKLAGGGRYWSASQGEVQNWLAPYAAGATVKVYYDPDNPKSCVLDRTDYGHANVGAFAVGWFLVGTAILGLGARIVRGTKGLA